MFFSCQFTIQDVIERYYHGNAPDQIWSKKEEIFHACENWLNDHFDPSIGLNFKLIDEMLQDAEIKKLFNVFIPFKVEIEINTPEDLQNLTHRLNVGVVYSNDVFKDNLIEIKDNGQFIVGCNHFLVCYNKLREKANEFGMFKDANN